MKKFFVFVLFCLVFLPPLMSQQTTDRNGFFYFGLGTHRSFYSKSTIHLKSREHPGFDFTLHQVRGRDDQGFKLNGDGAAQYSYVIGYYWKKKNWGIEFNFDHLKYFIRQGQTVRLSGQINGLPVDRDTVLTPGFIQLEHSDGANYAMINLVRLKQLNAPQNKKRLDLLLKAGAGVVVPKTNSTIMGRHYDEAYALSGYVLALEGGLRYQFLKSLFASASFKGAYANYTHFRIANGRGQQDWFSGQFNLMIGAQFPW